MQSLTHVCWQRKALEAEAKKIKTDMQQLITDFHGRLGELANHKLQVRRLIDVAELEMVLLWQAVVRDEDREIRIRQLARQADTAQLDHKLAGVPLVPVPHSASLPRFAALRPPLYLLARLCSWWIRNRISSDGAGHLLLVVDTNTPALTRP